MENTNRQSSFFGANGNNSFVQQPPNSTYIYQEVPLIKPCSFNSNIRNSG